MHSCVWSTRVWLWPASTCSSPSDSLPAVNAGYIWTLTAHETAVCHNPPIHSFTGYRNKTWYILNKRRICNPAVCLVMREFQFNELCGLRQIAVSWAIWIHVLTDFTWGLHVSAQGQFLVSLTYLQLCLNVSHCVSSILPVFGIFKAPVTRQGVASCCVTSAVSTLYFAEWTCSCVLRSDVNNSHIRLTCEQYLLILRL